MAKKILIIEDNAAHPTLNLEAINYQVLGATTASEGLAKALDLNPDFILMDLNMPDSNGFDLCKTMRTYNELRQTPIVIFSTENKLKNMVTAYEMGANYYIVRGDEDDRVLTFIIETFFTRAPRKNPNLTQYSV
ncbi:MAG: Response regulator receiver protein [Chloroflexi bacterium]|jgi:DNA-binding response OmpR family regulator|nr:Response regulator receiver protein [Chloroflexota bacterium]